MGSTLPDFLCQDMVTQAISGLFCSVHTSLVGVAPPSLCTISNFQIQLVWKNKNRIWMNKGSFGSISFLFDEISNNDKMARINWNIEIYRVELKKKKISLFLKYIRLESTFFLRNPFSNPVILLIKNLLFLLSSRNDNQVISYYLIDLYDLI